MSVIRRNIIPDTLKTFDVNSDKLKQVEAIFITPASFSFSVSEFENADYWYSQLGINIFPIQGITDFQSQDDPTAYNKSKQNFTYQTNTGKYRHKIKYDFSLDYHKIINELSGEIRIIYASGNILRATCYNGINIQGFLVSAFQLEKMLFPLTQSIGNSDLLIELANSDELNVYGYEKKVSWSSTEMDRLILNIHLTYQEDSIIIAVKYLDNTVSTITSSDLTWTDDKYGELDFSVFIPGDGIYVVGGFSTQPTSGCLNIQSTLYIGAKRYTFTSVIAVTTNAIWQNGNNRIWQNGNNKIWQN